MSKLDKTQMSDDLPKTTVESSESKTILSKLAGISRGMRVAILPAALSTFGCESGCNCNGCSACSVTVDGSGVQFDGCGKKEENDPYK